jgi:hypothetical protein
MRRLALIILLLMLSIPLNALTREGRQYPAEVRDILVNVIEAYGGEKRIERVRSVYAEGEVNAIMRGDSGPYIRYLQRDRKLRVETRYQRSSEVRILNGESGWRTSKSGELKQVAGIRYLAMLYQFKQLDLPYGLMSGVYEIRDGGSETLKGMAVRTLELKDDDGPPMKIFIDTESFHIVKVVGYFTMGDRETTLAILFSDFKPVGGVAFPFHMINYGSGFKIGETVMKTYSLNREMDEALFTPR